MGDSVQEFLQTEVRTVTNDLDGCVISVNRVVFIYI